jgi:hypothetical protein
VVTAVVVLASAAVVWAAPSAVTLELKGEPGQESRYASTLEAAVDVAVKDPATGVEVFSLAPRLVGSIVTVGRVVEVAENGDLTLASRVESFDFSLDVAELHARLAIVGPGGGPPQVIKLPELPIYAVVGKRGNVVAIQGLEALPIPPLPGPEGKKINLPEMIGQMIEEFSQPAYPEGPVAVGDTWGFEMVIEPLKMAEMMGTPMPPEAKEGLGDVSFPINVECTLVAFETVNGIACAKIETESPWELSMPMGPPEAGGMMLNEQGTSTVVTWFDYSAGRKVRETAEVELTMTVGAGPVVPVRMEMRITGETELK